MRNKIRYVTIIFACLVIGLTATSSFAKKNACGKEMTAEEMAERALDIQEIQNVMGMHQLLGCPGGDHDLELELIWAQKTPGVTFAHNVGIYTGIDVLRRYYGTGKGYENNPEKEQSGTPGMIGGTGGNMAFRTLTTPIIEIAGDGKTAKGYWYSPGFQSTIQDGKGNAIWTYEKYAIDFVKEDGKWKIWHFRVNNDWDVPMGKDLAQHVIEQAKNKKEMPPRGPQEDLAHAYKPTVFNEAYSPTRQPNPLNPRPPEPYCTFSDTFSYGHE